MEIGENGRRFRSDLELVIERSPNTIIMINRDLTLIDVVAAKDDYYRYLSKSAVGKRPEHFYAEGKNREQYNIYREAVDKAFKENSLVDFSHEIDFEGKTYYYLSQVSPCDEDRAILYVRNISSLKAEKNVHELINTILDHLPLGVFVKNAEDSFRYLYWNRFMEKLTGINSRDVIGYTDLELEYNHFLPAEDRESLNPDLVENESLKELRGRVKTISGDYKDIEITQFPVNLKNGKPLVLGLWRDISASLQAEESLRKMRTLNKMSLQISDIRTCCIFVDPDNPNYLEDAIVNLADWRSESDLVFNSSWKEFIKRVYPEDKAIFQDHFERLCRGEMPETKIEARMSYEGKDGYIWRELYASVYEKDEKNRPTVLLGCSINIQERKGQELNLEEAKMKAETADKMKSKYLADMSHEIRTPLSAITGFSELMAFADSDEERVSYYEVIKMNNQLLMQLINDILDISKIEADVIKITYAPIDVNEVVETIYASARVRMPDGVKLILEKGTDRYMFGTDSNRLLQLVNNLVNNAIKNTKEGSITMGYECLPDRQLRFYVRDTGSGIAAEQLQGIFDRFVKVNDYVEGIGLGLAICKGLVRKMGGSIRVTSELGIGSEFSFILPSHD